MPIDMDTIDEIIQKVRPDSVELVTLFGAIKEDEPELYRILLIWLLGITPHEAKGFLHGFLFAWHLLKTVQEKDELARLERIMKED